MTQPLYHVHHTWCTKITPCTGTYSDSIQGGMLCHIKLIRYHCVSYVLSQTYGTRINVELVVGMLTVNQLGLVLNRNYGTFALWHWGIHLTNANRLRITTYVLLMCTNKQLMWTTISHWHNNILHGLRCCFMADGVRCESRVFRTKVDIPTSWLKERLTGSGHLLEAHS